MKKNKKLVASKIPYEELKKTAKDIGKNKAKVALTAKDLKITAKKKGEVRVRVVKNAKILLKTAKEIGETRIKVAETAKQLITATKRTEEIRNKLSKEVPKLKTKSNKKAEEKRIKLVETAKKLAKTAVIKEGARVKMAKKATKLRSVARGKEEMRIKLAKTAVIKEGARVKMAKKAETLRESAKEKEETRIQLAKTAAIIKELSDRNEAILSSIGDAAFACDNKGSIVLFNKMAEVITGIAKKEALGTHYNRVTNFVDEKTGKRVSDFILEAIKTKKKTEMETNTLLVRRDGKKVPVADTAAPIFDSSGKVTGCVVVFRDVTKERSIDRAKTELVSLSSHQLRAPLTAIGWYVELLQSKTNGTLTTLQQKLASEIEDAHKRMTSLVNSLLNVSRIEMGTYSVEPKSTDVVSVAKATLALFNHQIDQKKLTLRESYGKNLENFRADPKILGVIFQNLISNAVKYTPIGGKIEFKIKKQDSFEISISDNGMGIPKYQQSKIFTKLFRADNANNVDANGTGLGLYIVNQIVKASNGTVRFESEVGRGTTFYVKYPLKGMTKKEGEKSLT